MKLTNPLKIRWITPAGTIYNVYENMTAQPHLLIAGATGSGKSVVINGIIATALHSPPSKVQFILIDPKRVELVQYARLPHTLKYASEPGDMLDALNLAMQLTEKRYKQMQRAKLRKYNGGDIYVIIDEFADLMTTQRRTIQPLIQRLAQIGRAAKVHIILATQTPIAKVLPTEIKCNFDSRFGLRTRSAQDSRNIIGKPGLEQLPQFGQGYYMTPQSEKLYYIPYIAEDEITRLTQHWSRQRGIIRKLFPTR